jgi:hypothetical protein
LGKYKSSIVRSEVPLTLSKKKFIKMLKNSVPTSKRTYCISIKMISTLMLCKKRVYLCSVDHDGQINTLDEQNSESVKAEASGTYFGGLKGYDYKKGILNI